MKNEIVRCICTDMTVEGHGIARNEGGLVLFVKGLLTGEEADVKIISHKKNVAYAIIDRLITPSPYRCESACPVAYKCGGCDLRHMSYEGQLQYKKKTVENTLHSAGLSLKVRDVIGADLLDRYRDKAQVPFHDGALGYYRRFSNDIVEEKDCLLQSERVNAILQCVKEEALKDHLAASFRHILVREGKKTNEIMVGLIVREDISKRTDRLVRVLTEHFPQIVSVILNINTRNDNVILGEKEILLYGRDYLEDELDGLRFRISFRSFYQIHPYQAEKLYAVVRELGEVSKEDRVFDLYCGIGTISLYLARYAKEVIGIEIVDAAVKNAEENAKLNGIENARFYCRDAKEDLRPYLKDCDLLVVDPPRKGLAPRLIESLKEIPVKKIVYVSCNAATFARDLKLLEGHYEISEVQPVDMFPQTVHIETVCALSKLSEAKHHISLQVDMDELDVAAAESKATYHEIQD
ncbi:MAG: 23S rRNA (uracil(1939)-C(5))-methyltransferase RlmD [Erysipelotrichaceae bacterium]|nr:23S rRNA (uracil(1939)-C(5))-methyltransferase RlmD [Erysipelotrichaceae bacterium]